MGRRERGWSWSWSSDLVCVAGGLNWLAAGRLWGYSRRGIAEPVDVARGAVGSSFGEMGNPSSSVREQREELGNEKGVVEGVLSGPRRSQRQNQEDACWQLVVGKAGGMTSEAHLPKVDARQSVHCVLSRPRAGVAPQRLHCPAGSPLLCSGPAHCQGAAGPKCGSAPLLVHFVSCLPLLRYSSGMKSWVPILVRTAAPVQSSAPTDVLSSHRGQFGRNATLRIRSLRFGGTSSCTGTLPTSRYSMRGSRHTSFRQDLAPPRTRPWR